MIIGVFVKLIPEDVCRKVSLFKDREIAEEHMDNTLTSQLRRKSTIRLHTNPNKSKDEKSFPSALHPVGE
jgi:P-type Ca2+ transporter type 2B